MLGLENHGERHLSSLVPSSDRTFTPSCKMFPRDGNRERCISISACETRNVNDARETGHEELNR